MINDRLSLSGGLFACLHALIDDFGQIVNGVKKYIIELPDLRFDISRYSNIYHGHRAMFTAFYCLFDSAFAENRQLRGSGRNRNVRFGKYRRDLAKRCRFCLISVGQLFGALQCSVGDQNIANARGLQMLQCQFNRFTRTNHQRGVIVQFAEYLFCQRYRGKRDRNRAGTYCCVCPDLFRYIECRLKQQRQVLANGAGFPGFPIGLLDLAENLRLSENH